MPPVPRSNYSNSGFTMGDIQPPKGRGPALPPRPKPKPKAQARSPPGAAVAFIPSHLLPDRLTAARTLAVTKTPASSPIQCATRALQKPAPLANGFIRGSDSLDELPVSNGAPTPAAAAASEIGAPPPPPAAAAPPARAPGSMPSDGPTVGPMSEQLQQSMAGLLRDPETGAPVDMARALQSTLTALAGGQHGELVARYAERFGVTPEELQRRMQVGGWGGGTQVGRLGCRWDLVVRWTHVG